MAVSEPISLYSRPGDFAVLGIDPGTTNCAAYDTRAGWAHAFRRGTSGKLKQCHHGFLVDVVMGLFELGGLADYDAVVIEQQFDQSRGRVVNRFCHILQWEMAKRVHDPDRVLLVNPVHLKMYVTGKARPDPGELYATIERHIASGRYPDGPDATTEHIRDAYVLALMGQDWLAVQAGQTCGLRGPVDVVRKIKAAWA